jgi:hypothetical protein
MTGGFFAADSRAAETFSTARRSESPTAAVTVPHIFKKSRLDKPSNTFTMFLPPLQFYTDYVSPIG